MTTHPSQLALDRVALGADPGPDLARHLAACSACARALAGRREAGPAPAWAAGLAAPPSPRHRSRAGWLALVPALGAAALAAILLPGGREVPPAVREKGSPAVAIYLKRGAEVTTWDGHSPVRTDDLLRVGVRGGGYARVSVASLSASAPALLYQGPLQEQGETLLPLSFRVEGQEGAEEVSVVLSEGPVPLSAHGAPGPTPGRWSKRLRLAKEVKP